MDAFVNTNNNISFIPLNNGQRLLAMNEYLYGCNKKSVQKKYWKCIVNGCTMHIHTDDNDIYLCSGKVDHDHEPNSDLIRTTRLRQQMKQRVGGSEYECK
ncbi:unnamed protein product [Rotaria magnacalcarata]|uniref:FLYWCH-type domain-containing protein n=1 Tax=Rotaria magnacalcarata TaxID=392030 RepID=A0A816W171_9BILA|nr:unnamed protein product [Rotaria magnacalcarata]CAF1925298.1 unnamed protein product [Rotaria magnacalcarata]CAF2066542.1 unnamed protein product [Rotaria magnacalcarata]CAF2131490.1 unnamed protein product [Rotaria magnacalcarata]CAF3926978.1 unnamed protein product [Rotaria magnacalcarata]